MTAVGEAQEMQPGINEINNKSSSPFLKQYKWWILMLIYTFFLIAGQSVGTILGRLYFDNGGESKWMATLVQTAGFPVLFPFRWFTTAKKTVRSEPITPKPFPTILITFYIAIGIFLAADNMLYSIGLQYLPVTTYTLICASQLGFNALFSFFLNKQKFTPYIINSLVLLTISSVLLVFQNEPGDSNKASKRKYAIGFICTLGASAGYAIMLSLTQLAFQKIIKRETIRAIIDLTIYQNAVATFAIIIGLFASGDWKKMNAEMNVYKSGKVSYVMNLVWTTISWQVFWVGCIGLVFKVSSLFSNVISVFGLPVAPVLAVIFLRDKLTGLKAVAMLLAMWGFVSYIYQHYLDDLKMKEKEAEAVSEVALVNERGAIVAS
ncbi:hypothetical protein ACS0TY_031585 [Phlomoides rotata]